MSRNSKICLNGFENALRIRSRLSTKWLRQETVSGEFELPLHEESDGRRFVRLEIYLRNADARQGRYRAQIW